MSEKLSSEFITGLKNILGNCKHSDVKALYEKYEGHLVVYEANYTSGGAFYAHGQGVSFNSAEVMRGSIIHKPYQTAFHEFGHNIDYVMGNGRPVSETWGNNALYDAIKQDFDSLKGDKTDIELIEFIKKEMDDNQWTIMDVASVSDILESMTGISYPLGVGHGRSYWDNRLPNKEFFAETLDGAVSNEKSYQIIKKMFPRAVDIVHRIIGG